MRDALPWKSAFVFDFLEREPKPIRDSTGPRDVEPSTVDANARLPLLEEPIIEVVDPSGALRE